jgi:hypothetical protein
VIVYNYDNKKSDHGQGVGVEEFQALDITNFSRYDLHGGMHCRTLLKQG